MDDRATQRQRIGIGNPRIGGESKGESGHLHGRGGGRPVAQGFGDESRRRITFHVSRKREQNLGKTFAGNAVLEFTEA